MVYQNIGSSWIAEVDSAIAYSQCIKSDQQEMLFELAVDALCKAPYEFACATGVSFSRFEIAKYIACGAYSCAALAMLGSRGGYMLSRSSDDVCVASVVLPGMTADVSVQGPTEGVALLVCLLTAIQTLASAARPFNVCIADTSLRLH